MVVMCTEPLVIKLIDFGKSKSNEGSMGDTFWRGTPAFMAPEVMRSELAGARYDCFQADMWSCGALLFFLIFAKYAWWVYETNATNAPPRLLHDAFQRADWRSQVPPNFAPISPGCEALLDALLQPVPDRRLSAGDALRHAWTLEGMPPWLAEQMGRPKVERPAGAMQSEKEIKAIIHAGPK